MSRYKGRSSQRPVSQDLDLGEDRVVGHPDDGPFEGIITRGVGGSYRIEMKDGSHTIAVGRGLLRKLGMTPTVGDRVTCTWTTDPDIPARIDSIHERKNQLIRPPLANTDVLLLTFSVVDPLPDLMLLDKMIIISRCSGIDPMIVFTKKDLNISAAERLAAGYRASGFRTAVTSPDDRSQVDALLEEGGEEATVALAGPSGTGKSTLFNDLLGLKLMNTGHVSRKLKRGRHTTRHVELVRFRGGYLTDTPGFTSLELPDLGIEPEEVIKGYPELASREGDCRFNTCRHMSEPDCPVRDFVEGCRQGSRPEDQHFVERYERYRFFRQQLEEIAPYLRRRKR